MANSQPTKNPLRTTRAPIAKSFSKTEPIEPQPCTKARLIANATSENEKWILINRTPLASEAASGADYQLDLVTPGISPLDASSRKVSREILKRRMKARRRPDTWQRLTTRVGLASRGSCTRPA